jgi:hypothetical protein
MKHMQADFVGLVEHPSLPGNLWKRIWDDPTNWCGENSMKFRDLLPSTEEKLDADNTGQSVVGLYFRHDLFVVRVFNVCAICFVIAMIIAMTRADAATGFTLGAFVMSVPALFVAVLALVVAAR